MAVYTLEQCLERISECKPSSPLAVFKYDEGRLEAHLAGVVQDRIKEDDKLIGLFHKYDSGVRHRLVLALNPNPYQFGWGA